MVEVEEPEAFAEAAVDLTLGAASGGGPFEFSLVSGVAGDPHGRVIVVDQHWHEVRVVGAHRTHAEGRRIWR